MCVILFKIYFYLTFGNKFNTYNHLLQVQQSIVPVDPYQGPEVPAIIKKSSIIWKKIYIYNVDENNLSFRYVTQYIIKFIICLTIFYIYFIYIIKLQNSFL